MSKLHFPTSSAALLEPYLPAPSLSSSSSPSSSSSSNTTATAQQDQSNNKKLPHLTLTYAQSLDGVLALAPGLQTHLSGPETKALTHFLRSRHDAILVGVGTAAVDDPGLNCRMVDIAGALANQPRPVILDTYARWDVGRESRCVRMAREGVGKGPWVVCSEAAVREGREDVVRRGEVVGEVGGEYIFLGDGDGHDGNGGESEDGQYQCHDAEQSNNEDGIPKRLDWRKLLAALKKKGIESLMVEGGGQIINGLLSEENKELVDSVIVTVAPVWLGQGGVDVSPPAAVDERGSKVAAVRLRDVKWYPFGEDIVLCGRVL